MLLTDLQGFKLDRNIWVCAAAIAVMRVRVNDGNRAQHRDRGEKKNFLNDLQGAIGELLSAKKAEVVHGVGSVSYDLNDFTGPVNDVDIVVKTNSNESLRIESKCLLWDPSKKFFLINAAAHVKANERNGGFYLPVLASIGGARAITGSIFSVAEVDSWQIKPFNYGDPAHAISLKSFCRKYLKRNWERILEQLDLNSNPSLRLFDEDELLKEIPAKIRLSKTEILKIFEVTAGQGVEVMINSIGEFLLGKVASLE